MKMEVEIISKEKIKPSSPTPSHLRIFKLSLLDQLIPAPYAPMILFYDHPPPINNDSTTTSSSSHDQYDDLDNDHVIRNRLDLLKTSLSETLSSGFYPLAGKIKDDLSIECNDEGANYVEARVKYCNSLHEFLNRPDLLLLNRFLPCEFIVVKDESNNIDAAGSGSSSSNCNINSCTRTVTNIQVNVFNCGGIAIGICISHKILDGAALCTFLKAWTAIARGRHRPRSLGGCCSTTSSTNITTSAAAAPALIYPNLFAAASLFPTNNELWLRDSSLRMWGSLFIKGKTSSCVTKRFVFDAAAIAALKKICTSSLSSSSSSIAQGRRPTATATATRVEVVSALIWKCAMAASKEEYGFQRPSLVTHTVNLRTRILMHQTHECDQPAPAVLGRLDNLEYSIGNLLWIAAARCNNINVRPAAAGTSFPGNNYDDDQLLHGLVSVLRNALSKIDGDFVKKIIMPYRSRSPDDDARKTLMLECLKEITNIGMRIDEEDYYGFSSWCKLGFYEAADFGWGKPLWVSSIALTAPVFMNLIILVDTKFGDGIEAWVTLDQHHMARLLSNSHLQKFASFDPSPLNI